MRLVDVARLADWRSASVGYERIPTSPTSKPGTGSASCTGGRRRSWVRGRRDGDCGIVHGPHVQQFELPARNRGLIVDYVVEVLPP
jgi:hypothetical protein